MIHWPTSVDGKIWHDPTGKEIPSAPVQTTMSVPYYVAEEGYKEYSEQFGRSQSLEQLNKRGGFGASELCILLYERIKRIERLALKVQPQITNNAKDGLTHNCSTCRGCPDEEKCPGIICMSPDFSFWVARPTSPSV